MIFSNVNGFRSIVFILMMIMQLFVILWSGSTISTCTASSSSSTGNSNSNSNSTDRLALMAFKYGINGDPLGVMSSWNDSVHYCSWTGVNCSTLDRVTALSLPTYGLAGSLSPHIGNLTFLRSINLPNNSFHGQIPSEIGRLFQLRVLRLNNNSFDGTFPINLTKCSNLEVLNLNDNKLQGKIPAEVGSHLSKLQFLGMYRNHFSGSIPASLGNLSSLIQLVLTGNSLAGSIPEDLGRIKNLEYLLVGFNNLTGTIPHSFYNLSNLLEINFMSNQLSGTIHPDIGLAFPRLIHLSFTDNRFTGPIPVSLSNASNLVSIQFQTNDFTGTVPKDLGMLRNAQIITMAQNQLTDDLSFVSSLVNCTQLQYLIFGDNSLRGSLPSTIANLSTQILWISFGPNQIHGTLPSEIANLANLEIFNMGPNRLSGNIPPSIGKLQKLRSLYLHGNELSGRIPSSFGNLTLLSILSLGDNNLSGEIPPSLATCRNLLGLSLSNNNLNGSIPKEFFGLSSSPVLSLDFSGNALSGSLPLEIGNMIKLQDLILSNNRLSGALPNTLAKCLMVEYLRLDGNFFHGEIPTALQTLQSLKVLDLSRNNLSGHIPAFLGNLTFLVYLNLSFNELNGEVPKLGVFENATRVSVEGNDNLCGGIEQLNLPICPTSSTKKKEKHLAVKVVIPVITSALCFILLALILIIRRWRRNSRKNVLESIQLYNSQFKFIQFYNSQFKRISYSDLHKATGGFSESNIIGAGSYGSVYKGVFDEDAKGANAVKVFNLQRKGASKSFMSECKALRKIRHKNLVKILSACSSLDFQGNDFKALVYELMPQGSLEEWLHPKGGEDAHEKLNFQQRLNIAIDVASALEYLHSHCDGIIVHSDLKPSNVLLDDNMTAHVSDFGLAKVISAMSGATSIHTNESSSIIVKGSIGYVAPEYGVSGNVSTEGDVYSYGILLLEMFTGRRPTNDIFQDGLTLRDFVKTSLSERVMEIVDLHLFSELEKDRKMEEYVASVLRIGVTCSIEYPRDRMEMGDVLNKLHSIRNLFWKEVVQEGRERPGTSEEGTSYI